MATVGSLERGLRILDMLIEVEADPVRRPKGLSVQQVASELELHKSTASRMLQTLASRGYATPSRPSGRGYRLGPALQMYSQLRDAQQRFSELARPLLTELVAQTGECAHSAMSAGTAVLVIDDVETTNPLRVVGGKGRKVPLHCTSAGKLLLAYGLAAMPAELPARTPRTITNPRMLAIHLQEIVAHGYALDDEENDLGVRCISAPVFDGAGGQPLGCIGIDGPASRITPGVVHEFADRVVTAARQLTDLFGEQHVPDLAVG